MYNHRYIKLYNVFLDNNESTFQITIIWRHIQGVNWLLFFSESFVSVVVFLNSDILVGDWSTIWQFDVQTFTEGNAIYRLKNPLSGPEPRIFNNNLCKQTAWLNFLARAKAAVCWRPYRELSADRARNFGLSLEYGNNRYLIIMSFFKCEDEDVRKRSVRREEAEVRGRL